MKDFEGTALKCLLEDFNQGQNSQAVKLFYEHHLEELSSDELVEIFGASDVDINLFLSRLILRDVAFHPEEDEEFAVFDITLQGDVTNYLLAVKFDSAGAITAVSMES